MASSPWQVKDIEIKAEKFALAACPTHIPPDTANPHRGNFRAFLCQLTVPLGFERIPRDKIIT
eukprot:3779418-Amphidinium_carterae.1